MLNFQPISDHIKSLQSTLNAKDDTINALQLRLKDNDSKKENSEKSFERLLATKDNLVTNIENQLKGNQKELEAMKKEIESLKKGQPQATKFGFFK